MSSHVKFTLTQWMNIYARNPSHTRHEFLGEFLLDKIVYSDIPLRL